MNIINTPTPPYRDQDKSAPRAGRPPTLLEWFAALMRTPTPAYKPAPATVEHTDSTES